MEIINNAKLGNNTINKIAKKIEKDFNKQFNGYEIEKIDFVYNGDEEIITAVFVKDTPYRDENGNILGNARFCSIYKTTELTYFSNDFSDLK